MVGTDEDHGTLIAKYLRQSELPRSADDDAEPGHVDAEDQEFAWPEDAAFDDEIQNEEEHDGQHEMQEDGDMQEEAGGEEAGQESLDERVNQAFRNLADKYGVDAEDGNVDEGFEEYEVGADDDQNIMSHAPVTPEEMPEEDGGPSIFEEVEAEAEAEAMLTASQSVKGEAPLQPASGLPAVEKAKPRMRAVAKTQSARQPFPPSGPPPAHVAASSSRPARQPPVQKASSIQTRIARLESKGLLLQASGAPSEVSAPPAPKPPSTLPPQGKMPSVSSSSSRSPMPPSTPSPAKPQSTQPQPMPPSTPPPAKPQSTQPQSTPAKIAATASHAAKARVALAAKPPTKSAQIPTVEAKSPATADYMRSDGVVPSAKPPSPPTQPSRPPPATPQSTPVAAAHVRHETARAPVPPKPPSTSPPPRPPSAPTGAVQARHDGGKAKSLATPPPTGTFSPRPPSGPPPPAVLAAAAAAAASASATQPSSMPLAPVCKANRFVLGARTAPKGGQPDFKPVTSKQSDVLTPQPPPAPPPAPPLPPVSADPEDDGLVAAVLAQAATASTPPPRPAEKPMAPRPPQQPPSTTSLEPLDPKLHKTERSASEAQLNFLQKAKMLRMKACGVAQVKGFSQTIKDKLLNLSPTKLQQVLEFPGLSKHNVEFLIRHPTVPKPGKPAGESSPTGETSASAADRPLDAEKGIQKAGAGNPLRGQSSGKAPKTTTAMLRRMIPKPPGTPPPQTLRAAAADSAEPPATDTEPRIVLKRAAPDGTSASSSQPAKVRKAPQPKWRTPKPPWASQSPAKSSEAQEHESADVLRDPEAEEVPNSSAWAAVDEVEDLALGLSKEDKATKDEATRRLQESEQSNKDLANIRTFREENKLSDAVELALRMLEPMRLRKFFLKMKEDKMLKMLSRESLDERNLDWLTLDIIGQIDRSAERIARRLCEMDKALGQDSTTDDPSALMRHAVAKSAVAKNIVRHAVAKSAVVRKAVVGKSISQPVGMRKVVAPWSKQAKAKAREGRPGERARPRGSVGQQNTHDEKMPSESEGEHKTASGSKRHDLSSHDDSRRAWSSNDDNRRDWSSHGRSGRDSKEGEWDSRHSRDDDNRRDWSSHGRSGRDSKEGEWDSRHNREAEWSSKESKAASIRLVKEDQRVIGRRRSRSRHRMGRRLVVHAAVAAARSTSRRSASQANSRRDSEGHKDDLKQWLVGLDKSGDMLQYLVPLRREFGSLAQIAAAHIPGAGSALQCTEPSFFQALHVESLGHRLMLAKGVCALATGSEKM